MVKWLTGINLIRIAHHNIIIIIKTTFKARDSARQRLDSLCANKKNFAETQIPNCNKTFLNSIIAKKYNNNETLFPAKNQNI